MSDLIDTTEMYLRTIYELEEEGVVALRARIAERLGHSGPTVSQTVARMQRDGLLLVSGDRHLELTPLGRSKATRVMRKHRLAERLLLDVIGLEWEFVHDEACRWEHVMSDRVEKKLLTMLSHPLESPYGNPIPGLEELDNTHEATSHAVPEGLMSLPESLAAALGGGPVRIRRLGERLQMNTDLMRRLAEAGLAPGVVVEAVPVGDRIAVKRAVVAAGSGGGTAVVEAPANTIELPPDVARHVFVEAVA